MSLAFSNRLVPTSRFLANTSVSISLAFWANDVFQLPTTFPLYRITGWNMPKRLWALGLCRFSRAIQRSCIR